MGYIAIQILSYVLCSYCIHNYACSPHLAININVTEQFLKNASGTFVTDLGRASVINYWGSFNCKRLARFDVFA